MDFLDKITIQVEKTIENGYYKIRKVNNKKKSLLEKINSNGFTLITEIKHSSPTAGNLFNGNINSLVKKMDSNGSDAISVVVEPVYFKGEIKEISLIKQSTNLPVLMKDFIIHRDQITAAKKIGADAILLIQGLFERGYTYEELEDMISFAHKNGLEVLTEVHTIEEFHKAKSSETDIIGINNRNLRSMKVDINNTAKILDNVNVDRPVISESGITNRKDILLMKNIGVSGVLVGTSILKSSNIPKKIQELSVS